MKEVADFVVLRIADGGSETFRHLLARTAYNRYYYAIFLATRQALQEMGLWFGSKHSEIPSHLTGKVRDYFRDKCGLTKKTQLNRSADSNSIFKQVMTLISRLADIIKRAYSLRCTADYSPEVAIQIHENDIKLAGHKLSALKSECEAVEKILGRLLALFRRLG